MEAVDWPTIGVMVALGAMLWRQMAAMDQRLTAAIGALSVRLDALELRVGDVDRRLARLEGWIEGERAGRTAAAEGVEPVAK